MDPDVSEWSFHVFRRQPATIPPTVPMIAERIAETPTSAAVAGITRDDLVPDRLARLIGDAQVALGRLPDEVDELGQQWLIETECLPQVVERLLGDATSPEQRTHRVGLHHPEQKEVEDEHEDECEYRSHNPATDERLSRDSPVCNRQKITPARRRCLGDVWRSGLRQLPPPPRRCLSGASWHHRLRCFRRRGATTDS